MADAGATTARRRWSGWACRLLAVALAAPHPARAAPDQYVPVRDPIEAEIRLLDLTDPLPGPPRILLPHLGTRPLQWRELQGPGAPVDSTDPARAIALARLERALGRNARPGFAPHPRYGSTPFLWRAATAGDAFELSLGVEGAGETDRYDSRYLSGSGLQARLAASFDHWLVFSHLLLGQVDSARTFADPLVTNSDVILHTEDTYVAYTSGGGGWGTRLGRTRWNWGPGDEATLTLSRTAAALTGFDAHARIEPLRSDGVILSATVDEAAGEQLAAHRLEWQPRSRLRVGITETARYHAAGWQPLYLVGVIPYVLVQRLTAQDNPDSADAVRNNVMVAADIAWRPATGTRLYGELLIDDLHSKTSANPDKLGFQLGWEGVGVIGRSRVSWDGEYTRLSRYVYTSYFGRSYVAQGQPIGYPTGPDAERLALRGAWDTGPDWQIGARISQTRHGEGSIDKPYVPGTPKGDPFSFEGVVERERVAEAGLRWWPASGVDLSAWAGYRWLENAGHVVGASRDTPTAMLELRLTR